MTDLRLALRLCLRHPLLSLAAIASLALPTLFVQEGGYCLDVLGRNVANVLTAFEGA